MNNKNTPLFVGDIYTVHGNQLPDSDVLVGGFPCQAFSIAGYRKAFDDDRGVLFFQVARILQELKSENRLPRVVFFENVKNLFTINNGKSYEAIKTALTELGYHVTERIFNTCDFGNLPQNRERIYIVGFKNETDYLNFQWPNPTKLRKTINSIINWDSDGVDPKYFYDNRFKVYKIIQEGIPKHDHAIYQLRRKYVRRNQSNLCPALTANMGEGGHNVPIIKDDNGRIRKLTITECQMFQGFPRQFSFPNDMSDSRIYKQIGNSVSVPVITRIAQKIKESLDAKPN